MPIMAEFPDCCGAIILYSFTSETEEEYLEELDYNGELEGNIDIDSLKDYMEKIERYKKARRGLSYKKLYMFILNEPQEKYHPEILEITKKVGFEPTKEWTNTSGTRLTLYTLLA